MFYVIFALFWIYGGFTFSKSLLKAFIVTEIIVIFVIFALGYISPFKLLIQVVSLISVMWVYGNAEINNVRFKWLFTLITIFIPIIGVPLYLMLRKKLSVPKMDLSISDGSKMLLK
jgi:hypothetical protein